MGFSCWFVAEINLIVFDLGEEPFSYGYGGTGKISQSLEFTDYGVPFQLNDVVGVYMVHHCFSFVLMCCTSKHVLLIYK